VVQTERYGFIAPDNGLVSWALANESVIRIHQITNESLFLRPVSQTFHGRDVFAPVAARLSKGFPARRVGPSLDDFVRLDWPKPRVRSSSAVGEIIYIDRFGNAITNLNAPDLTTLDPARCEIYVRGRRPFGMAAFYQAVSRGQPSALLGSSGFLEIAVNGGSASKSLRLKIGDPVTVRQRRP